MCTTKEKGNKTMKTFEIHYTFSYSPAGTRYYNTDTTYIAANNKKEARELLKAELKEDDCRLESGAEFLEV